VVRSDGWRVMKHSDPALEQEVIEAVIRASMVLLCFSSCLGFFWNHWHCKFHNHLQSGRLSLVNLLIQVLFVVSAEEAG
jgi:hypothetical protein